MEDDKFEEGERVLCYEPDTNKVRVVYDAKILEVADDEEIGDGRTAKKYLVHFQGWSSSWDRFVSMDFLLKDTEENRELQRELFERADECIKPAKKKKKMMLMSKVAAGARNNVSSSSHGGGGGGSTSEDQRSPSASGAGGDDGGDWTLTAADDQGEKGGDDVCEEGKGEGGVEKVVPLELSESLKRHLEQDHNQVVKRRKLNQVPAHESRCVVSVLETFARHFASSKLALHEKHFGKHPYNSYRRERSRENLERVLDSVNVCKEVAESLRIMFDTYLESQLLYENEQQQFKRAMSKPLSANILQMLQQKEDPPPGRSAEESKGNGGSSSSNGSSESGRSTPTTPALPGSTKGSVSKPGSGGVGVGGVGGCSLSSKDLTCAMRQWRLLASGVPRSTPQGPLPSLLYGPIYLLRLFVKVPEIMGRVKIPQKNSKLVLRYMESLLSYLESNGGELFSNLSGS